MSTSTASSRIPRGLRSRGMPILLLIPLVLIPLVATTLVSRPPVSQQPACSGSVVPSGSAAPAATPSPRANQGLLTPALLARRGQPPGPGTEAQRLIAANGFAVEPGTGAQPYELYYKENLEQGVPSFVTSDLVLHVYHVLYDFTLRDLEQRRFSMSLRNLTTTLLRTSADQAATLQASGAPILAEAACRNAAYFGVALRLLDPEAVVPAGVGSLVEAELALINAHAGVAPSPIFDVPEDYSQYVPRGHYTRNEAFQRYFRAMLWYGRMTFRLSDERATQQALLLVGAVERATVQTSAGEEPAPALALWEQNYEPTVFLVGRSDDLSLSDYARVARQVWGDLPDAAGLADATRLARFTAAAQALPKPKLVSTFVAAGQDPGTTAGLRFMGQRFTLDSYIFQRLIHDRVQQRYLGKGLDVMAAFGSERALAILTGQYGEDRYAGYLDELAKVRAEIAAIPAEAWEQNLYWAWLHVLAGLLEARSEPYPAFMRNEAWTDKQLNTALGSWTELRHDTILYAKQPYPAPAGPPAPPPPPPGYVEPQPRLYARLAALAAKTQAGLAARGLLDGEFAGKLQQLQQLTETLQAISEAELRGDALSRSDAELIRGIGRRSVALTNFAASTSDRLTSEADVRMALVADVQTDPRGGLVLEEGVGDAFTIWVVLPNSSPTVLARGAVFSYYEFTQPMGGRLTDEAWQSQVPKPPLPKWTRSFIAGGRFE